MTRPDTAVRAPAAAVLASSRRLVRGLPTAVALLTILMGAADITSVLMPERARRLHDLTQVVPLSLRHAAAAATLIAGVLLVLVGAGLRRRKRRAWRAAVVLLAASTALHLVRAPDQIHAGGSVLRAYGYAIATGLLLLALVVLPRQFYAAGDPRTRLRAPAVFLLLLVASFVLGYLLLVVRGGSIAGHPSVGDRLDEIALGLVGVTGPIHFRYDGVSDLVGDLLLAFGAVTVLTPAYQLLRPAEPVASLSAADEAALRELLERHGERDSLGYFALRRDKAAVFSPTGKAAVSYRVVSGVMLASADPIGDPEAWPGAIEAFLAEARRHAWVPAVMGCSERAGEVWARLGSLRALELGDEATLEVEEFSLDGRAMRNVRQMVARVERAGYVTQVRRVSDLTAEEIADIRRQAASWRGAEVERGFSMALGRFGDPADGGCVVVTAHRDGRLAAVLHFVPWGEDGLSLELMRRDREADPGLNELMIVAAVRAAPALGVTRLSLNFAAFRSALERGGRLGAGPVLRLWRGLLIWLSRWFQIESLYRFNAKFRPVWEPRFILYPGAGDIPRVAIAALEAEAFLVWPKQWLALRRARAGR